MSEDRRHRQEVAALPCVVCGRWPAGEAHHAGRRPGIAMKASDHTTIPLCHRHHVEWHAAGGFCKGWDRARRRDWQDERIAETLHECSKEGLCERTH